jgi:hypothetical protein
MESTASVGQQYLKRIKPGCNFRRKHSSSYWRNKEFIEYVEEKLKSFVKEVEKGKVEQVYYFAFRPMTSYRRWVIHLLAKKYGCKSTSHDSYSGRYTVISTTK